MRSHELARQLLEAPDLPVVIYQDEYHMTEARRLVHRPTLNFYRREGLYPVRVMEGAVMLE